jgi:hypothetical protein
MKYYLLWNESPEHIKIYEITKEEFEKYENCHGYYINLNTDDEDMDEKLQEICESLEKREPIFAEFDKTDLITLNGPMIICGQVL